MSQSSNNNFGNRQKINFYDSLAMDSPILHSKNYSRFSKLADRSCINYGSNNLSTSSFIMNDDSLSISMMRNNQQNYVNKSSPMSNSSIESSSIISNKEQQFIKTIDFNNSINNTNKDDEQITEDEMSRLSIFQSFFELNQKFLSPKNFNYYHNQMTNNNNNNVIINIFTMIELFQQTCDDNLLVTKKLLTNKQHQQSEYQLNYLNKFYQLIRLERNIWCLIKVLFNDRFLSIRKNYFDNLNDHQQQQQQQQNNNNMDVEIEEDMRLRLNDSELVERFMEKNSMLREMQIIIDWLESMYYDDDDNDEKSIDKMDFYSDGPHYWENTLHQLKNKQQRQFDNITIMLMKNERIFCNEMDPDAPIRNGQSLHDLDKEDENRLFHYLFKLIRSGRLPDAKEIAERFGYYWLSAAMDGWIYHNDPNYNNRELDDKQQQSSTFMTTISSPNSNNTMSSSLLLTTQQQQYASSTTSTIKQLIPIYGNPYRDLWKLSSWKCSKMDGTNLYERAIFAIFSGNRSILMPLCNKWMDKLWAYFKCSLDVHLENLLIDTNISKPDMQPRINIELPDSYWDNRLTPSEIFNELDIQQFNNLQTSKFITKFEDECYRNIVKNVILSNIDQLIDQLYEWSKTIQTNRVNRTKPIIMNINEQFNTTTATTTNSLITNNKLRDMEDELMIKIIEPNLLRLFAHIVICLKELNLISTTTTTNNDRKILLCIEILEIYIGYLIEFKLVELIAYYIGFLPQIKQIQIYAKLLETIDDESDRRICLIIAKNAKLNISAILSLVVENIRLDKTSYQLFNSKLIPHANFGQLYSNNDNQQQQQPEKSSSVKLLSNEINENDYRKINSLNWLLLDGDNKQYLELLWQSNSLIRYFLLEQKIDLAYDIFNRLPSNIINESYNEWKLSSINYCNLNNGFDIENVIREYLCHTSYFDANESFKKWHHFLYTTKPREPNKPKTPITRIADRVLYEQKQKQYENDIDIWNKQLLIQAKNTAKKILDFLCFPNGIWLDVVDSNFIQEIEHFDDNNQMMTTKTSMMDHNIINDDDVDDDDQVPSILSLTDINDNDNEQQQQQLKSNNDNDIDNNDDGLGDDDDHFDNENLLIIQQQFERKKFEWKNYRPKQLDCIRQLYIPQFTFLLHSIYRDTNDNENCLNLANIIADEQQQLYKTFTNEQLIDFLSLIRETSIKILQNKSDPFGCFD